MENLHQTIAAVGKQIADAIRDKLPEAPASITAKVYDANGFDLLVTVRNGNMAELIDNWGKFSDILIKRGYQPQGGYRPQVTPPPPAEPTPAEIEAEMNPALAAASAPPPPQPTDNGLWFHAETLAASMNEGKVYWKVKGGKFSKFGVNIWPETLDAAFKSGAMWDVDGELDPATIYNITGLVAHYTLNDKGQPQKVTALVRPTQATMPGLPEEQPASHYEAE